SEGFLFGPSLTLRVRIGRFISAARLAIGSVLCQHEIFDKHIACRSRNSCNGKQGACPTDKPEPNNSTVETELCKVCDIGRAGWRGDLNSDFLLPAVTEG
ncbi:MAG: hypothetical protein KDB03_09705, partial [Planctomycetales bacterium]|nr:hypothetical protein [Planctomycetales bacterium]